MSSNRLKQIAVNSDNYDWLKTQGRAGDSFNDVITHLRERCSQKRSNVKRRDGPAESGQLARCHFPMQEPSRADAQ